MDKVLTRAYVSPTLVLLALDWPEGHRHESFLGFAIKRTPGFWNPGRNARNESDWLPNRIGFNGPPPQGQPDFDSSRAPIQKFMWWDARIDEVDRGATFQYEIWPMLGDERAQAPLDEARAVLKVTLPQHRENGIGTYFNRAVVSSQAFSRIMEAMNIDPGARPSPGDELKLRTWLANDLEKVVPEFLENSKEVTGAIYHLTDRLWVIPSLAKFCKVKRAAMVYDARVLKEKGKVTASPNQPVVDGSPDTVFWLRM